MYEISISTLSISRFKICGEINIDINVEKKF